MDRRMSARPLDATRVLLHVMLWSLAAAAAGGAIAVLTGSTSVLWQTVGTLMLMAVCAGLLLLISRWLFEPDRAPGLLGTGLVLAEFLLGIASIWSLENLIPVLSDRAPPLMLDIFLTGTPAIILLKFRRARIAKAATVTGLGLCCAVFLIWLIALWLPWSSTDSEKWWEYGLSLAFLGALATGCLIGLGTDRWHWRWIGVLCVAGAFALSIRLIALERDELQPITALISAGVIAAYINLILRCPLRRGQSWLIGASIIAMVVAAILFNASVEKHERYAGEWMDSTVDRAATAFGILGACGTLAITVLMSINRRNAPVVRPSGELVAAMEVTVLCPVCHRKQSYGKDGGTCAGCGLRVRISVEEPRCPACGYSLLMFKDDRCPECGAALEPSITPAPSLHKSPG
jgi:hypothetical protein